MQQLLINMQIQCLDEYEVEWILNTIFHLHLCLGINFACLFYTKDNWIISFPFASSQYFLYFGHKKFWQVDFVEDEDPMYQINDLPIPFHGNDTIFMKLGSTLEVISLSKRILIQICIRWDHWLKKRPDLDNAFQIAVIFSYDRFHVHSKFA